MISGSNPKEGYTYVRISICMYTGGIFLVCHCHSTSVYIIHYFFSDGKTQNLVQKVSTEVTLLLEGLASDRNVFFVFFVLLRSTVPLGVIRVLCYNKYVIQ